MKLLIYSDLHLEFGNPFKPPMDSEADVMILAGDIITFKNFEPLQKFLEGWEKPVIFVAGNHEYYTKEPMLASMERFFEFIKFKNIAWLDDLPVSFGDVNFFGGTMWTNFAYSPLAMMKAKLEMNDFHLIRKSSRKLTPEDTCQMHELFKDRLIEWLEKNNGKKRVVITHHAPCLNLNSAYKGSELQPAFNSLEMVDVIEKYQPELWVYGHTHECDDQMIGETRIVSNQFGYHGQQKCPEFNDNFIVEV